MVCANLKALTACGIPLPELLWRESDYKAFLAAYDDCIGHFSRDGAVKAKAGADAKLIALVQEMAQQVAGNALSLIHTRPHDILGSLDKELKADGKCSSVLSHITYLANATNLRQMLGAADKLRAMGKEVPADLQAEVHDCHVKVKDVFLKVVAFSEDHVVKDLAAVDPEKGTVASARSEADQVAHDARLWACEDYMQKTLVEMMGRYADSVAEYVGRSRGKKKASEAAIKAKELRDFNSGFVVAMVERSMEATTNMLNVLVDSLEKFPVGKVELKDEDKKKKLEQYRRFESKIMTMLKTHSVLEQNVHVIFNSLSIITQMDYTLKQAIIKSGLKLLKAAGRYYPVKNKSLNKILDTEKMVDASKEEYAASFEGFF